MKIGVPKEIKPQEHRIGLTPDSVKILTSNGHEVLVENNGGFEAGFYNIDIDTSTLVDLSKNTVVEQQRANFEVGVELTK